MPDDSKSLSTPVAIYRDLLFRLEIGQQSPRFCCSLECSGRCCCRRTIDPAALHSPKHFQFDSLGARFAHGIGAVPHVCLAALEAAVIVEVIAHLVVVFGGKQFANCDSSMQRQEPRLEKYV